MGKLSMTKIARESHALNSSLKIHIKQWINTLTTPSSYEYESDFYVFEYMP
jgi:hypothetical protein